MAKYLQKNINIKCGYTKREVPSVEIVYEGQSPCYDDRTIEEMINSGDYDSTDFNAWEIGGVKQYPFGNIQRGYRNHK